MNKVVILPYDKYARLNSQDMVQDIPQASPQTLETAVIDKVPEKNVDIDSVLIGIPKQFHSRAKSVLHYILEKTSITWNQKGEICIKDKHIPFSNMTDLIKDSLFQYKHFNPIGEEEFYSELKHIPLSLIQNVNRRKAIQDGRGQMDRPPGVPPPPGIPDSKIKISLYKKEGSARMRHKEIKPRSEWKELWTPLQ